MKEFHIYFGLKDADLLYWKQSIPDNCFGNYVRAVLVAEKKKKIAYIPVPSQRGFAYGKSETKIHLIDKEAASLLESIPKFKRNAEFRRILRKHLEANYNGYFEKKPIIPTQPEESEVDTQEVQTEKVFEEPGLPSESEYVPKADTTDDVLTVDDEAEDDEMSEEYKKMLKQMSGQ